MAIASQAFGTYYIEWRTTGNHIHQRAVFAVQDKDSKWLAWYLFVDGNRKGKNIESELISGPQVRKTVGSPLLDGGLIGGADKLEFDSFAPRYGNAKPSDYTKAMLRFNEEGRRGRITCQLAILTKQGFVTPTIRFQAKEERWNPVNRRDGVLWLLGTEKFSAAALKRGPTKAVYGSGPDPYSGYFSA